MILRWLKRLLKFLAWTVAILLVAVFGLVTWVVVDTRGAWEVADKYLLPDDLDVTWEKIDFQRKKENWRSWQIRWEMLGLDIKKGDPQVAVRVEKIELDFGLKLWLGDNWFSFRSVEVLAGQPMRVRLGPSKDDEESLPQSPYQMARTYLGYVGGAQRVSTVERLNIVVPEFRLESSESPEVLILKAKVAKTIEQTNAVSVDVRVQRGALDLGLKGTLSTIHIGTEEGPFFDGDLNIQAGKVSSETKLKLHDDGTVIRLNANSAVLYKMDKKAIRAMPNLTALLRENEADIAVQARVTDIPGPLVELEKVQAKLNVPLANDRMWSESPANFRVWSLVELFFIDKNMRRPLEAACQCKIPERLELAVEGKAWLDTLTGTSAKRKDAADVRLNIESLSNKMFSVDIKAAANIDKEGTEWIIEPALDSVVKLNRFQGLRQFLDAKGVMIPAPLDVLNGTVTVTAKGPVVRENERLKFNAKVETDLKSTNQIIDTFTEVLVDLDSKFKGLDVYVKALVRDIQLELPPLDPIRGIPPVSRDSRVMLKPVVVRKKKSSFKSRIFLDIKTEKPGGVRLLSKLAKPFIPISLDITAADGKPDGFLKIEPFKLSYLRRVVAVEGMQINLEDKEEGGLIVNGRFRVDQADYKIFIDVAGKLESPNVNLHSQPYLPHNEIISVLLYNRTSNQLNSSDAETAGNFQGAVADKAIGLFGLWAFASTPIQSFSYNPVTKKYTATVQLGEGLTAGVGTNWEQSAHLEVRKRVSRKWVLTASWAPSENEEEVGQLVLQWEQRF